MVAAITIFVLKPADIRQMARTMGRWLNQMRRMSREFTSELYREAEEIDRTEARARNSVEEHEIGGAAPESAETPEGEGPGEASGETSGDAIDPPEPTGS